MSSYLIFEFMFLSSIYALSFRYLAEFENNIISASNMNNWAVLNPKSSPYPYSCGSENIFGGRSIFDDKTSITRSFSSLPAHYKLELDFMFFALDHPSSKHLQVEFDSIVVADFLLDVGNTAASAAFTPVYFYENNMLNPAFFNFNNIYQIGYQSIFANIDVCGGAGKDYVYNLKIVVNHTSSNLAIALSVYGGGFDWGIKNVEYILWRSDLMTSCDLTCLICDNSSCTYCPSNYFSKNDVCMPCNSSCSTCNEASSLNCTSCFSGYYSDNSTNECLPCDSSCLNCSGGSNSQCTACATNYFLYNGMCGTQCPSNFYENYAFNNCSSCDSSCFTCDGGSEYNCTDCYEGFYLDSNTNKCSICNPSCLNCSGPSNLECLACLSGSYLLDNQCINECPEGYYAETSSNKCFLCDSTCKTCINGTIFGCSSCYQGNFLDISTNQCLNCDNSCLNCSGPSSFECTACINGTYLLNSNCLSKCGIGYFEEILDNSCEACDRSCETCSGPSNLECTTCINGLLFSAGRCINSCNSNQYVLTPNNSCENCDSVCTACYGPSQNECLSCVSGYFLDVNSCVSKCPNNKFQNENTRKCENFQNCSIGKLLNITTNLCDTCNETCRTCETFPNKCASCYNGYFLKNDSNECFSCDSSCNTCNGSLFNNCLSCRSSYTYLDGICILKACQSNQYWDRSILDCFECDSSCMTCKGSGPNNCLSCDVEFMLNNNKCEIYEEIFAELIESDNPYKFELIFYPSNISHSDIFQELPSMISISLKNFRADRYNYSVNLQPNSTNYTLNFIFLDQIEAHSSYLEILINNSIYPTVKIMNTSFEVLLNSSKQFCSSSSYYYKTEDGDCIKKKIYDYSWSYTVTPNIIKLFIGNGSVVDSYESRLLNEIDPFIKDCFLEGVFYVQAESWSLRNKFFASFEILNDQINVNLVYTQDFYGGFNIILKFNDSRFLEIKDSYKFLFIKHEYKIYIMDNGASKLEESLFASTTNTTLIGEIASQIFLYSSFALDKKSSFAIRGMMIIELFQIVKFLKINYPENVRMVFSSHTNTKYFFKEPVIHIQKSDEILWGLPQLFVYYDVSISLLNNILNDILYIILMVFIACLLNVFVPYLKCRYLARIFEYFKRFFVWGFVILTILSKYLNTTFYVFCSMKFSKAYDRLNDFLTMVCFFFVIFFPYHIFMILSLFEQSKKRVSIISTISPLKISPLTVETSESIATIAQGKSEVPKPKTLRMSKFGKKKVIPWENFKEHFIEDDKEKENKIPKDIFDMRINLFNSEIEDIIKKGSNCDVFASSKKILENTEKVIIPMKVKEEKNIEKISRIIKTLWDHLKDLIRMPINFLYKVKNYDHFKKRYFILKRDLKENPGIHNYYYFLEVIRYLFIAIIVALIYGFPLIQTTIMWIQNLIFLLFAIFEKPFKGKITILFSFLIEICVVLANFSILYLALMDLNGDFDIHKRLKLGWIFVFSYLALLFSLIIRSCLRIIEFLLRILKGFHKKQK